MVVKLWSACFSQGRPLLVEVEVTARRGVPGLVFVGLPSHQVEESRERITSALTNSGIRIKALRTVVNLAPADLPKSGSSLELAIAAGLLAQYGLIRLNLNKILILGELSLDGSIKSIRECRQLLSKVEEWGIRQVVLPADNLADCQAIGNTKIVPLHFLNQLRQSSLDRLVTVVKNQADGPELTPTVDLANIQGLASAKRALEVAAAGRHHMLLCGPPGGGKSLLAEALVGLLPPLSQEEKREINQFATLSVRVQANSNRPPLRRPHHSIGLTGLLGGGYPLQAGEVSLAHLGVLFLDELSEFKREVLEGLREPLESGRINLVRRGERQSLPAQFQLLAATNPCPCGFLNSPRHACQCSATQKKQHWRRLSGPLLDRIDLFVWIDDLETDLLNHQVVQPESSSTVRQRIETAWQFSQQLPIGLKNPTPQKLPPKVLALLNQAAETLALSNRGVMKTVRVARSIANLAASQEITTAHLAEALSYRSSAILPNTALLH